MATVQWSIEAQLARKEQVLIDMFHKEDDVDDYVIEHFADALEKSYPGIFKRQEFIAKCKQKI